MGSFEIASGTVVIDPRSAYLHVVQPGPLATEDEVVRYVISIEREANVHGLRRALIDARNEVHGSEPPEVRLALWRWLQSTSVFEAVALIMPDPLAETRVNMLAVSQRMLLRAFVDPAVALRWLTRASRSSSSFKALDDSGRPRRTSSFPPPVEPERTFGAGTPPTGNDLRGNDVRGNESRGNESRGNEGQRERPSTSPGLVSMLPPRKTTRP